MAKLPSTIYSVCADKAVDYTTDVLRKPTTHTAVMLIETESVILPYQTLVSEFYSAGYGAKKIEKWINEWSEIGLIKWRFYDSTHRYVAFLGKSISNKDYQTMKEWFISEKDKKVSE